MQHGWYRQLLAALRTGSLDACAVAVPETIAVEMAGIVASKMRTARGRESQHRQASHLITRLTDGFLIYQFSYF